MTGQDDRAADPSETIASETSTGAGDTADGHMLALTPAVPAAYELEGEQGRGGIGVVLRVRDRRLGRLVALKQLQHVDAASAQRFEREMRIMAQLQHPGVVPVHEVGQLPGGEPYYAMKLIEGHSLQDVIAGSASLDARLALLPRVIAVAETVAYAHSRGVIHRDLKPANVVVGNYGETIVIDWGTATLRGDAAAAVGPDLGPAGAELTAAGAVVGTPAYMPPEQARGEEVDERADVYALGALLYHLLAGKHPYQGVPGTDAKALLVAGPPPPVQERQPGVPAELAAVVARAMASSPSSRYPTADELAADLRRFQTGQLVAAHHYSAAALVRRWLARNRVTVAIAAVLVAALAATAAVSVARIVRERDRAEAEKRLATTHRDAAERLVEFLVVKFRDRVREADRLDLLVGVGDEVAAYYRELDAVAVPAEPGALARRAAALETLAVVEAEKKNAASARTLYQQAIALRERAAAARPPAVADLVKRGEDWTGTGVIENEQGNVDAALASYQRAIALADQAARLEPSSVDAALLAGSVEERVANTLQFRKGDLQGAYDVASRARARLEQVLRAHPDDARLEATLARLHSSLHLKELYLGRLDDAARSVQASIDLYARATRRKPDDAGLARAFAGVYFGLSGVEVARGRVPEAIAAMRQHLDQYEAISRKDPDNLATQRDLGWSYAEDCKLHRRAMQLARAAASCDRSLAIFRAHVARDPGSRESKDALVNTLVNRSRVAALAGRGAPARTDAVEAVALSRALAASDPSAGRWQDDLALALIELGRDELELRHLDAAGAAFQEALAIADKLAAGSPGDVDAASGAGELRALVADVEVARGQRAEALAHYEASLAPLEAVAAKSPGVVFFQARLARVYARYADALAAEPDGAARAGALRGKAAAIFTALRSAGHLLPEDEAAAAAVAKAAR